MKFLVNLPLFLSALEESEPHKHNFLLFSLSSLKYGTENPLIILFLLEVIKGRGTKLLWFLAYKKGDVCGNCLALACIIPISFQFTFSLVSGVREECGFLLLQFPGHAMTSIMKELSSPKRRGPE
jgi:hypothetical protein